MRVKTSNIVHSSMLLGAKIFQALLDNFDRTDWRPGLTRRIDQLHRLIDANPNQTSSTLELENRLTGVMDLANFKFIMADTASGYSLMKHAAPLFHRVACSYPMIWTDMGAISLPHAINLPNPEIFRFVWMDTISALIFGTNPLLCYDGSSEHIKFGHRQLEWMYGCPEEFVVFLGRINTGRSYFQTKRNTPPSDSWSDLETEIKKWVTFAEQSTESCTSIARLAVHECWRHTLLIYLYMGVCGANSADSRVDLSVHQIIQLLGTVKNEAFAASVLKNYQVGICARKERQRALVRKRIASLSATKIWIFQGADFTSVLDYLWHGAAKNGHPVIWDDYAASRRAVLPIDE
ncbi:hypothetical protein FRC07_001506 [Ceratobasidium sp. 392]|nr:hypothetical protein FRC07_001506 [Ceratobasidium sp. 392]